MHQLTLMLVHAHPDDEVFGSGGLLLRARDEGVRTVLVTATLGEEGQIVDAELNTPEVRERLGEVRRAELERAAAILGVGRLELLGYRDSGMAGAESNSHPECFHMADQQEAAGRLVRLIRAHRPHVLVSYNAQGGYGHPDHIACHRATLAAWEAAGDGARFPEAGEPWAPLKLYEFATPRERWQRAFERMRELGMDSPLDSEEFPLEQFTVPEAQITAALDVSPYLGAMREATLVHRTQIAADSPFLNMPDDLALEFNGQEFFTLLASRVPLPAREGLEDDLFAGVR